MNKLTEKNINDYLYFGYIPEFGNTDEFSHLLNFKNSEIIQSTDLSEEELIGKGITILNEVFDELVKGKENEMHLIPLSGGLDSRLILAALLERVDHSNILATTFGTPGSFDYDIPEFIAKKIKIRHKKINCTKLDYSIENLVSATLAGGRWSSVPDNYINRLALNTVEKGCKWSGFMGGEIAGDYAGLYSKDKSNYVKFAKYQKRVKNIKLTKENYSPETALIRIGKSVNILNEFELIYYYNRSLAGAIPIIDADNKDIIIPFLHPKWVSFISNIPSALRLNSKLFRSIIFRMYPEIFNIPCKNNSGLSLNNKNKLRLLLNHSKLKIRYELVKLFKSVHYPPVGVNYLYYKEAFKVIPSLNKSIKDACISLEKREVIPWISPLDILATHLSGKEDYSQALLILLGLEVNLKAEEILSIKKGKKIK